MAARLGAAAILVALVVFGTLQWQASHRDAEAAFWYDVASWELPPAETGRLGGPLTAGEASRIEQVSRQELQLAFAGLRIRFTENRQAFWRVTVRHDLEIDTRSPYVGAPSGVAESRPLGPLGGVASVSFSSLGQYAVTLAPPGTGREGMIDGIGRGIARAAAHELGHLIAVDGSHDETDVNSYEYKYANRASQYYGTLHWSSLTPSLQRRLGVK